MESTSDILDGVLSMISGSLQGDESQDADHAAQRQNGSVPPSASQYLSVDEKLRLLSEKVKELIKQYSMKPLTSEIPALPHSRGDLGGQALPAASSIPSPQQLTRHYDSKNIDEAAYSDIPVLVSPFFNEKAGFLHNNHHQRQPASQGEGVSHGVVDSELDDDVLHALLLLRHAAAPDKSNSNRYALSSCGTSSMASCAPPGPSNTQQVATQPQIGHASSHEVTKFMKHQNTPDHESFGTSLWHLSESSSASPLFGGEQGT